MKDKMARIYDIELECGCLISSDGGGGLIPCYDEGCKWDEWMKTEEYKKHLKEVRKRNPLRYRKDNGYS